MSIPVILAMIGVLIVVAALALVARQMLVSRERGAFVCTLQRRTLRGERWQHGLMRFGRDQLDWYHAMSLRVSPSVVIRRGDIDAVGRRPLAATVEDMDDACLVEVALRGGGVVRAVVDLTSSAALNAWLEAAPTGLVAGDAD